MKGIALSTIALFVIAIVGITLLIAFIGINFSPALKKGYCDVVRGLLGLLPLPEHAKPSLPSFCTDSKEYQRIVIIEAEDPERIAYEIAAHSMACWKITGEINVGRNVNCFELVLKKVKQEITVKDVMEKLPLNYRDKINWQTGEISTPKSIGIYYNATEKLVWVV